MTVEAACADLLRFYSGRAVFTAVGGVLQHRETVVTMKRAAGESVDAFIARVTRECPDGEIELLNNAGQADVARFTRPA